MHRHEALRLCPPAPGGQVATSDVVVDGYPVPAGTNMVVSIVPPVTASLGVYDAEDDRTV